MTEREPALGVWEGAPPDRIANRYYDATTWIYRRAWGRSFHFAPLAAGEARRAAIRRYEEEMAAALELATSSRCLDLGCGVGGPASTIAAVSGARITGLNANVVQLAAMGRAGRREDVHGVHAIGGDFGGLPFRAGAFDVAYAFEALCHAVDLGAVFREIHRVLRPGGRLGFSEWCLTDAFDPRDETHRGLRRRIEASYGVAALRGWGEWHAALAGAGFRVARTVDRASAAAPSDDPWYRALLPRDRTLDSLGRSRAVRALLETGLAVAERVRLAPRDTGRTVRALRLGTAALVEAGRRGIFTPMRLVVATRER